MKVLLVFPMKDKQTGLFIKRAFEALQCKVQVVDAKTNAGKMLAKTEKFKPDMIFCSRTRALCRQMEIIKDKYPNILKMAWNVDKRDHARYFHKQLLKFFSHLDILYTIAAGNITQYKQVLPDAVDIKHLQQGCDPITHKKEQLTKQDHKKYDCDVMFAGRIAGRRDRTILMKYIRDQGLNLKTYGLDRKNYVIDSLQNKANLCSTVVLGHNCWPKISTSMSVRDYKVMASGGFLLTEYCPGIENWFKIGEECEIYKTKEECVTKIKYYMAHEEERKKIAEAGYKIVHAKHKYIDRIRQVLDDAREWQKKRL